MQKFISFLAAITLAGTTGAYADHGRNSNSAVWQVASGTEAPAAGNAAKPEKAWFDITGLPAPRLANDLGNHHYKISTSNPAVQQLFNQGLTQAYGFNHLESLRLFKRAQGLDPDCAMCFWGEAYVLGANLNIPMDPAALDQARAVAKLAAEKAARTSPKELSLTSALVTRYEGEGERSSLDAVYAVAMLAVARQYPDDPDIASLAAEAQMLLAPWDYWLDVGRTPKPQTKEAQQLLERALKKYPSHVAAIHHYIHLVEASDQPERAEPFAERLRTLVPGQGLLVHMPSHIFLRLGRYGDTYVDNRSAAAADEKYFSANTTVQAPYRLVYYPHNVHFCLTAALPAGQAKEAVEAAKKLSTLIPAEAAKAVPPVQPIQQAPYFVYAQFSNPEEILALPEVSSEFPYVAAARHYARGIAFALLGDHMAANCEVEATVKIAGADHTALEEATVPAKIVLDIAANTLRARILAINGDQAEAQRFAEAAVAAEKNLPYMEPPYWYMPAQQTLGAIMLAKKDMPAAAAFREALLKAPNSVWALKGLHAAQLETKDPVADEKLKRLTSALPSGEKPPELTRY